MWNTFTNELTAQNGSGLEFRLLIILWTIVVIGLIAHSVLHKKKKQTQYIMKKYEKVS